MNNYKRVGKVRVYQYNSYSNCDNDLGFQIARTFCFIDRFVWLKLILKLVFLPRFEKTKYIFVWCVYIQIKSN